MRVAPRMGLLWPRDCIVVPVCLHIHNYIYVELTSHLELHVPLLSGARVADLNADCRLLVGLGG
jgi:hypothetical protein